MWIDSSELPGMPVWLTEECLVQECKVSVHFISTRHSVALLGIQALHLWVGECFHSVAVGVAWITMWVPSNVLVHSKLYALCYYQWSFSSSSFSSSASCPSSFSLPPYHHHCHITTVQEDGLWGFGIQVLEVVFRIVDHFFFQNLDHCAGYINLLHLIKRKYNLIDYLNT